MGKSGPSASFNLFFHWLGWPWVGEFVGFIIIFICFPTQHNLVYRTHPTTTGSHSNQDPWCTQKPIYTAIFSHHIRSWLLCTPVNNRSYCIFSVMRRYARAVLLLYYRDPSGQPCARELCHTDPARPTWSIDGTDGINLGCICLEKSRSRKRVFGLSHVCGVCDRPLGRFPMVDISTVGNSVGANKVGVGNVSPRAFRRRTCTSLGIGILLEVCRAIELGEPQESVMYTVSCGGFYFLNSLSERWLVALIWTFHTYMVVDYTMCTYCW